MTLVQLRNQKRALLLKLKALADKATSESRELTEAEQTEAKGYLGEIEALAPQVAKAESDEAFRKQLAEMVAGLAPETVATPEGLAAASAALQRKTLGRRFVEDERFKGWLKAQAPGGVLPEGVRFGASPAMAAPGLMDSLQAKALVTATSDTSGGAFINTQHTGIYEELGRRPLSMLDLVTIESVETDTLDYVVQTAKVTQAAPYAETNVTTYSGATGEVEGAAAEGTLAWEVKTISVKNIAVWIPATKQALADVSRLRSMIDNELRSDCREDLEDEIWSGSGTGTHLQGITHTSGVLEQVWEGNILDTCRKAKTLVWTTSHVRPTAWAFNPADWEKIELLRDLQGRYYAGGPFAAGPATLWGLPVVEAEVVDEGTGALGAWNRAMLWNRQQETISISDSHEDFFTRQMVAILANLRAAFGLTRPSGFALVDLDGS